MTMKSQILRCGVILLLILLSLSFVLADLHVHEEHQYSFHKAEALTPLIEWRDYGPDAFDEAIRDNKPIFLLLTAPSWCYWCQVYESEDYLFHPDMVKYVNENVVPIYVDADKRQDLTRQYLEGGWPSTTVMSPDRVRLYGFSGPRPVPNMVANLQQAVNFVNSRGFSEQGLIAYEEQEPIVPSSEQLQHIINRYAGSILGSHDKEFGGFGTGQKFPQGRALDYSLDFYELTRNQEFLDVVTTTLRHQYTDINKLETDYNLYDPVEGGFHRYGTKRDYSPPHYEKMLYDNARLIKAYYHLLQIEPNNELAQEVVEGSLRYMRENYIDPNGGFFANTDVAGEAAYYAKNPRPTPKARVEQTKYTDWNADAIVAYLYLYQVSGDEQYKEISVKALEFIQGMVTDEGVYHYQSPEGERGVRGNLLDNAYAMLALVEGAEILEDESYRKTAMQIADQSFDTLYDWKAGGFFERNSPDTHLYAPGDHIRLVKPNQENGIIAYALAKLFIHTNDQLYLDASLKSIGITSDHVGTLDRGYYHSKAAQFILNNNLLGRYDPSQVQPLLQEHEEYWLTHLVNNEPQPSFEVTNEGLDRLEAPLPLLMIIALLAGFISFISPCTLPILPAYVAYTLKASKQNIMAMTLAFFLGLSVVFTLLGMSASFIGSFLQSQSSLFSQIAGIAIVIFGVLMLLGKGFGITIKSKRPTSYVGSFLFGTILAISWTPCVGPILVAILLLASTSGSVASGGILLFIYGLGLSLPLILLSKYLAKKGKLWKFLKGKQITLFKKKIHTSNLISGLIFIVLGLLMFFGILYSFNQYISSTALQQFMFRIEEWLLGLIR